MKHVLASSSERRALRKFHVDFRSKLSQKSNYVSGFLSFDTPSPAVNIYLYYSFSIDISNTSKALFLLGFYSKILNISIL